MRMPAFRTPARRSRASVGQWRNAGLPRYAGALCGRLACHLCRFHHLCIISLILQFVK
jgi:hypothetical protein